MPTNTYLRIYMGYLPILPYLPREYLDEAEEGNPVDGVRQGGGGHEYAPKRGG